MTLDASARRALLEANAVPYARGALAASLERHADASLGAAVGSDYMVEHWLAAYALLLLS